MKNKLIVFVEHGNIKKPLLKIIETDNQVICALLSDAGTHLTFHKKNDDLLITCWDKRYNSVHSEGKRKAAKNIGYKNWEKPGNYLF
jgi:hypothetical protein